MIKRLKITIHRLTIHSTKYKILHKHRQIQLFKVELFITKKQIHSLTTKYLELPTPQQSTPLYQTDISSTSRCDSRDMAPIEPEPSLKRASPSDHDNNEPAPKRRQHYHRHHRLREPVTPATAVQDSALIDQQLERSIGLVLNNSGFEIADPLALSSFRHGVEECMARLFPG